MEFWDPYKLTYMLLSDRELHGNPGNLGKLDLSWPQLLEYLNKSEESTYIYLKF